METSWRWRFGHLDTDRRATRDRRQDADVGRRHGVGDVLVQARHPGHLDPRAELQLVAGHRRADGGPDEAGLDTVGGQGVLERAADGFDHAAVDFGGLRALEQGGRRQAPGPLLGGRSEGDRELLGTWPLDLGLGGKVDDGRRLGRGRLVVVDRASAGGTTGAASGGSAVVTGCRPAAARRSAALPIEASLRTPAPAPRARARPPVPRWAAAWRTGVAVRIRRERTPDGRQHDSRPPGGQEAAEGGADGGAGESTGSPQVVQALEAGPPGLRSARQMQQPGHRQEQKGAAERHPARLPSDPAPDERDPDQGQEGRDQQPAPAEEIAGDGLDGVAGRAGQVQVDPEGGHGGQDHEHHAPDVVGLSPDDRRQPQTGSGQEAGTAGRRAAGGRASPWRLLGRRALPGTGSVGETSGGGGHSLYGNSSH